MKKYLYRFELVVDTLKAVPKWGEAFEPVQEMLAEFNRGQVQLRGPIQTISMTAPVPVTRGKLEVVRQDLEKAYRERLPDWSCAVRYVGCEEIDEDEEEPDHGRRRGGTRPWELT